MKWTFKISVVALLLVGCSPNKVEQEKISEIIIDHSIDTIKTDEKRSRQAEIDTLPHVNYLSTRKKLKPYTFTTEVQRRNDSTIAFPFDFKELAPNFLENYGLLDFNKDGFSDLFLEYYGMSGTGEKNVIDVYFYVPTKRKFSNEPFRLMNPNYFYDQNIITAYYYGLGGGTAFKYRIKNGKLDLVENIDLDINNSDGFEATLKYSQKPFKDTLIFKDNMVRLPEEYGYRPIIDKKR